MTESKGVDPGLSSAQVAAAVAAGHTNATVALGRRTRDIVRDNLLTRFNAVLGTLFVITAAWSSPRFVEGWGLGGVCRWGVEFLVDERGFQAAV